MSPNALAEDQERLTVRENWRQIGAGRSNFSDFFELALFGNGIHVLLTAACAIWEERRRP
jgi:hypothetical protein